jgi:hypothetical protein
MPPDDPCALIDRLDPAEIRLRISELDRQRAALVVLLRAADARKRASRQRQAAGEEVPRAG